jgi:hypothetical protein
MTVMFRLSMMSSMRTIFATVTDLLRVTFVVAAVVPGGAVAAAPLP